MINNKAFEVKEFNNVKEIIYNSAEKFADHIAFTIKKKENKEVKYKDVTYKQLLADINSFGTALYDMELEDKRIAVIGKNRYEWTLAHLTNLLRRNCINSFRQGFTV